MKRRLYPHVLEAAAGDRARMQVVEPQAPGTKPGKENAQRLQGTAGPDISLGA
ncbi:hypothetical protein GCM10027034_28580 [Ramlibacter solisilvae]